MGFKSVAAGGAAGFLALKAYEIEAKRQGWSYDITPQDRVFIIIASALLGWGAAEILNALKARHGHEE